MSIIFSEKEFHYESCSKITSTPLGSGDSLDLFDQLHQLKADKKKDVFRIGISQFITHQSLDATREGFVDELAKQGYVEGKNIEIDLQNAQGEQRNLKRFPSN